MTQWSDYLVDALQRSELFLDLLRQRGNNQIAMEAQPSGSVLRYAHEVILSGRSLPRRMNYDLWRVLPPDGVTIDPARRPVVVVDPRAGEGPGIGGFKAKSEIGDALDAGHPVYFIAFSAIPEPGQQFLDVVEGQITFFQRVVERHPDAPLPFAIGNCQAGYQTLMVAMLRPDLFGPLLLAGSPMSYWQGEHGRNPMRYAGGLAGGSWTTALVSDLGHGRFDGTWLVLNFDALGPANWLWGKQYAVYADVDAGGKRYLEFENWWGDFVQLNGDELQYLVDNLFIGDKLMRNQLQSTDGKRFDVRRVTSPIILFASTQDNISPPPQSLGWIADVYSDVDDIKATGQTIIYCLSHSVGHLAIFVSSKVGAEEDEDFIAAMDIIDCLPPGLYEMVITGKRTVRFEARGLDDIRILGRNSAADDLAFAAVAKLSERNLAMYRAVLQPWVRAIGTQRLADIAHTLNPLRLSYTIFADSNPWMQGVKHLAAAAAASRQPVAPDNPLLVLQEHRSEHIKDGLDAYRVARDWMQEQMFFGFYGSTLVQACLGLTDQSVVRPPPMTSPEKSAAHQARIAFYAAELTSGGFDAAMTRALLYVFGADQALDQRRALALHHARRKHMKLSVAQFKLLIREQFFILTLLPDRAVEALAAMVPVMKARRDLLAQTRAIAAGDGVPTEQEVQRLARVAKLLDPAPLAASEPGQSNAAE